MPPEQGASEPLAHLKSVETDRDSESATDHSWASIAALVDVLVPRDQWAGGWAGGVRQSIERAPDEIAGGLSAAFELCAALDECCATSGGFASIEPDARPALLRSVVGEDPRLVRALREVEGLVLAGYYGGSVAHRPEGWRMLGYDPWPHGEAPSSRLESIGSRPAAVAAKYDVVVIGSGPGGGAAARVLSEAGARVLILERGRPLSDADLSGDHIHGKRMAVSRPTAGPGPGNPRLVEEPDGSSWMADGDGSGPQWGLNAMCLGGGTRLWQGMAWRMTPEDFRMSSLYGTFPQSSLVDWPVSYHDMRAYYDEAEHELGVSGDIRPYAGRYPDHPGYEMPALPSDRVRLLLGRSAEALGWTWGPIPFAINSVSRGTRQPCSGCWQCMGHACPVGAKNGSHNTTIASALSTGRCDLLMSAIAVHIDFAARRARSIDIVVDDGGDISRRTVEFDRLVVAAGAIESPRLLMASGIGNENVGRHLHAHTVARVVGLGERGPRIFRGPGHSIATLDFAHDGECVGGGLLFDCFAPYPLQLAEWGTRMAPQPYGLEHKRWVRDASQMLVGAMTMAQQVPLPGSHVGLDAGHLDRYGVPAVRISRSIHSESLRTRDYLVRRCTEWLAAADVHEITDVSIPYPGGPGLSPAGEHSAGTVRMGCDPQTSASTVNGRVRGTDNVYVCDASALPTIGGVNPALTIMANALRLASCWQLSW